MYLLKLVNSLGATHTQRERERERERFTGMDRPLFHLPLTFKMNCELACILFQTI